MTLCCHSRFMLVKESKQRAGQAAIIGRSTVECFQDQQKPRRRKPRKTRGYEYWLTCLPLGGQLAPSIRVGIRVNRLLAFVLASDRLQLPWTDSMPSHCSQYFRILCGARISANSRCKIVCFTWKLG